MARLAVLVLLALLSSLTSAQATTYYVTKTGSDSNTCTQAETLSTAKLTIRDFILDCGPQGSSVFGAGDTLLIRAGTYAEGLLNTAGTTEVPAGTSWSNKVTFAAYPGDCGTNTCETVWMSPTTGDSVVWLIPSSSQYIEFDGINMDGGQGINGTTFAVAEGAHHIRIQNAEIIRGGGTGERDGVQFGAHYVASAVGTNEAINLNVHGPGTDGESTEGYAVYLSGPGNLVERCELHHTSSAGVHIYNGGGDPADNNIVRYNNIHHILSTGQDRGWGILVAGDDNQIYNNIITNIDIADTNVTDAAIFVYYGDNTLIYNNTIAFNSDAAGMEGIGIDGTANNTQVFNNILYANDNDSMRDDGVGTDTGTNLIATNPLFTNAGAGDFSLSEGSPAIDAGTTLAAVTDDIADPPNTRPQGSAYDIGAYEFAVTLLDIPSATGTIVITENFTCSAGANLTTLSFVKQSGATGDAVCTDDNRARGNTAVFGVNYVHTTNPISAEYDVSETWFVASLIAGSYYGLASHMDPSTETMNQCFYDVDLTRFSLKRTVGGVPEDLYFGAATPLSVSGSYTVTLKQRADAVSCELDGTTVAYKAGAGIVPQYYPGMTWYASTTADTNSTGIKRDGFTVRDVVTLTHTHTRRGGTTTHIAGAIR